MLLRQEGGNAPVYMPRRLIQSPLCLPPAHHLKTNLQHGNVPHGLARGAHGPAWFLGNGPGQWHGRALTASEPLWQECAGLKSIPPVLPVPPAPAHPPRAELSRGHCSDQPHPDAPVTKHSQDKPTGKRKENFSRAKTQFVFTNRAALGNQ